MDSTPTGALAALSQQMADAVETAGKSLVMVNGRARQAATGIAYGDADLVLTADHVLEREDNLTVRTHDGRSLPATLVGRDPTTDLAVLRVPGLSVPGAKPASAARVGQIALAVGRPSEDGVMASMGVVSKVGGPVRLGRGASLDRVIQTDATPYPGFSGGALVDATGAVFGLLTTGLARGAAIVIPMDIAFKVAGTLTQQGYVKRGYLGIVSQQVSLPPSQRTGGREHGLLVVRVEEGSPAEKGGLMVGDIVFAIEDHAVNDADDLLAALSGDRVDKPVAVGIMRGGAAQTVSVTVGQRS
jgi:S1-C subfamily serine protease